MIVGQRQVHSRIFAAAQGNAAKSIVRFHDDTASSLRARGTTRENKSSDAGNAKNRLQCQHIMVA